MKITIIGALAKEKYFDSETTGEIWGLNGIRPKWIKKWDRMFNLHMYKHLMRDWEYGLKRDIKWARKNKDVKFYVCDLWPKVPDAIIFPREDLKLTSWYDYHCGSFDWLVAFAIHEGATEIDLHGINLVREAGEPISARACLEYWCGVAEGKGIKVRRADDCYLMRNYYWKITETSRVYSYDDYQLIEYEEDNFEYKYR
jgi:hypothetical protein